MAFVNHMLPPSPDDRYNQSRVVEGSRGPTGVLESHINSVDRRSSHDDTYVFDSYLPSPSPKDETGHLLSTVLYTRVVMRVCS